jgi:hypothetical protein
MFIWKALNDFRLVTMLFIVMGASACSSNNESSYDQRGVAPEGKHEIYQGPLYHAYRSVQESLHKEKCDTKLDEIKSTLITALDLKSDALLKASLKQKKYPENYIPFAKSYLVNNPKKTPREGWQLEPYSWGLIYEFYRKNLDKNKTNFWPTVNAYVRSLITDDRKRVVYGYNLSLNHEQIEKIPALKEVTESCMTDTRCIQPHWSDEQLKLISEVPAYNYYYTRLNKFRFFRDKRNSIEKLFNRIEDDYTLHHQEYNDMVTHRKIDGKEEFTIPLDASNFSDEDRFTLEKAITSVWMNDDNAVSLTWKKSTPLLSVFRFLFSMEPNNRSYVNFGLKEIHLFPFTSVRTVAHELGHVLGFDDHYYTIWDSEKCEYRAEFNEEDIMSSSDTGDVTSQEWHSLFEQYGDR